MHAMTDYGELLDPSRLTDSNAIDSAVRAIQRDITESNCISVLSQMLSAGHPERVALLLSDRSSIKFKPWILNNFPLNAVDYIESPVATLLTSISDYFTFSLLLSDYRDIATRVADHYRQVRENNTSIQVSVAGDPQKRGVQSKITNTLPNDSVPVERQKNLLDSYLRLLQESEIRREIRGSIKRDSSKITAVTAYAFDQKSAAVSVLPEDEPEICPQVPTGDADADLILNVALLNQNIDGFGMWPVIISSRAERDLREERRRDKKTFLIIVKKIRDLSRGNFSGDNQIKVSSSANTIPIFQAKATYHTRLIYQVDCVPDTELEDLEKQCLRIFGVYTPTDLKHGEWDAMSKRLAKKGKQYNNCNARIRSHSDRKYFIPASFPHVAEEEKEDTLVSDLLQVNLSEEFQVNMILQKFILFSQALLHSIIADLESAFPLELSLKEKSVVEHPLSCYVLGRSGTGKTTAMLHKMLLIEKSSLINNNNEATPRQLFVTQSAILADKVEEYFRKMSDSVGLAEKTVEELKVMSDLRKHFTENLELVDRDEERASVGAQPASFSELDDEHFPLFLTFDRLCTLLEHDMAKQKANMHDELSTQSWDFGSRKRRFVSYNRFYSAYWCHFNQSLTKGLDPHSLFNEFLGVIEGSELAMSSPQRYLDLQTYEMLGERTNPTFSNARSVVYDLFQTYRAMKGDYGDYDRADRTHSLLRSLGSFGIPGRKLDYLYVDEAQDNLMIDSLLLRSLCRNPNGLFWAGDTAQTIASGCSFRFQDLKSMMYRLEKKLGDAHPESELPKTFSLAVNYRSHSGIVDCARSVVDLIHQHWPYSIDALAPETGIVAGPLPIFLDGYNMDNIQIEHFLFGASDGLTQFGARQCILVRNDTAKDKLREKVGETGLIMTIQQSKGLEFNDVLLYNFFLDSDLGMGQWRFLIKQGSNPFDSGKHTGLCGELKSLYVALTRAKKNLWIADFSEKAMPMRIYWTQRDLVKIYTPLDELPRLGEISEPEQWAETAQMLFERKLYSEARNCFRRALRPREEGIANSYALRDSAERLPSGQPGSNTEMRRKEAFKRAAESFLTCAEDNNKPVYFCKSAECFEEAAEHLQAAAAYYRGNDYTNTVNLFYKLRRYDEAVAIIREKKAQVRQDLVVRVISEAKRHHLARMERDLNSTLLEKARLLFDTEECMLEYSKNNQFNGACSTILISIGRLTEAAGYLVADDQKSKAIELLLGDGKANTTREAYSIITDSLWREMPFGFRANAVQRSDLAAQLLAFSTRLESKFLTQHHRATIEMFHALHRVDRPALFDLGKFFFNSADFAAATHCLWSACYTEGLPDFRSMALHELAGALEVFQMYLVSMTEMSLANPGSSPGACRLFGLEARDHACLFVFKNTFIYEKITSNRISWKKYFISNEGLILTADAMSTYRDILRYHLRCLLQTQSRSCLDSGELNPCLDCIIKAQCNREICKKKYRDGPMLDCQSWYNFRIRIHLMQIGLLQNLNLCQEVKNIQRAWILSLRKYEAFHPLHNLLRSISGFDRSSTLNFDHTMQVLNAWTRARTKDLRTFSQQSFLADLPLCVDVQLSFDKNNLTLRSTEDKRSTNNRHCSYRDVVDTLLNDGITNWPCLAETVKFAKHVVDNRLSVDLTVLCAFLDRLCGLAIFHESKSRSAGFIHDVLLPKSWWLRLLRHPISATAVEPPMLWALFNTISSLLRLLLGEEEINHLYYRSRAIQQYKPRAFEFWTHVSRLCMALSLLGHNTRCNQLRVDILALFQQLSSTTTLAVPTIFKSYFMSTSWDGVIDALHKSSDDISRGRMLLVCKRSMVNWERCSHWDILYDDEQGLRVSLLQIGGDTKHAERAKQKTVNENENEKVETGVSSSPFPEESELREEEDEEDELGENENKDQEGNAVEGTPEIGLTQDEINSLAKIIGKYVRKRFFKERTSVQGTRALFMGCLEQSHKMEWSRRSHYKKLYLGPLPHLLSCLETLDQDIAKAKKEVMRQMGEGHGDEIAKASDRWTEISSHFKEFSRLKKALGPTATVHKQQDEAKLKKLVEDAAAIIQAYPSIERTWDLEIAMKGIVRAEAWSKT